MDGCSGSGRASGSLLELSSSEPRFLFRFPRFLTPAFSIVPSGCPSSAPSLLLFARLASTSRTWASFASVFSEVWLLFFFFFFFFVTVDSVVFFFFTESGLGPLAFLRRNLGVNESSAAGFGGGKLDLFLLFLSISKARLRDCVDGVSKINDPDEIVTIGTPPIALTALMSSLSTVPRSIPCCSSLKSSRIHSDAGTRLLACGQSTLLARLAISDAAENSSPRERSSETTHEETTT
mmetsp:Transcript_21617/g.88176  ORF Transcript_21617/g.88176 Transcript_21617/m.88176 type:complete len:236 (+) Transcript_21617:1391-2098(+)